MAIDRLPSPGAGIPTSTVTAKGDLIAGTANNAVSRLAVGTNGYTLVADSAEATGLKWAAPAGGSSFVGVMTYNAYPTTQSISANTATSVNFGNESFDTDGFHSTSSNTSRLTVPSGKAGYYLITGSVQYEAGGSQSKQAFIRKNGTAINNGTDMDGSDGSSSIGYKGSRITTIANLAVGDYVEFAVFSDTATTVTNYNNGSFGMYLIGV